MDMTKADVKRTIEAIAAGPKTWNSHESNNPDTLVILDLTSGSNVQVARKLKPDSFKGLKFHGPVRFENTNFSEPPVRFLFEDCHFFSEVEFVRCNSQTRVDIMCCHFHAALKFDGGTIVGGFNFQKNTCNSSVTFSGTTFNQSANFSENEIRDGLEISNSPISGDFHVSCKRRNDDIKLVQSDIGGRAHIRIDHPGSNVTLFDCKVSGNLDIEASKAVRSVNIQLCTLEGRLRLNTTSIQDKFFFRAVTVKSICDFSGIDFEGVADFSSSSFSGPLLLSGTEFKDVPDFRRTAIIHHLSLHDIHVRTCHRRNKRSNTVDASHHDYASIEDRLRRLKDMAKRAEDHENEMYFFAEELKARRRRSKFGAGLVTSFLYQFTSDFGRSLGRPLFALFFVWSAFTATYAWLGQMGRRSDFEPAVLSLMQMMPFLTSSRLIDYKWDELFEGPWNYIAAATGFAQGILSAVFIFLALLALRNKFRL